MGINSETGSRLIHLMHAPSQEERAQSLSHCHVCLRKTTLTKEHIPPKKAFNTCNRLWERLVFSGDSCSSRDACIRGGLWVKTLCESCNNALCSPYAEEYVKFTRNLVESPKLFDLSGQARLVSMREDTLLIAKEIATMILAVEQLHFSRHRVELRTFVQDRNSTIDPPFRIYAFLVPDVKKAGTVVRFHSRVDSYAPGFGFMGGEISWFPFGFVYASKIGKGYQPEKLTDISHWFSETPRKGSALLKFYCRVTGVDSIQSALGIKRIRPHIDHLSELFV